MFTAEHVGKWVKLHPATDWWMRGATRGKIEKIGRKYVHVRLARAFGPLLDKVVRFRVDSELIELE